MTRTTLDLSSVKVDVPYLRSRNVMKMAPRRKKSPTSNATTGMSTSGLNSRAGTSKRNGTPAIQITANPSSGSTAASSQKTGAPAASLHAICA